jgi:predicted aspartyl protease
MSNSKAFTLKSDTGLLRDLKTHCGVCKAFNPLQGGQHPEINQFLGLWDTGATGSVISKAIVDKLDLKPIGKSKVFHANGESIVNVYAINLFLPNQVAFQFVKVTEGILNGFDLLIGMDIITTGDFSITNVGGKTTFSFRVPSIKEVDFLTQIMQ